LNPIQQINITEFDLQKTEKYVLSIDLKIDGLSFIVLNEDRIVKGEIYEWPMKNWSFATSNFKSIFANNTFLKSVFLKTIISIKSKDCTLIPNKFYDASKNKLVLETYLGEKNLITNSQALKQENAHLIYSISSSLNLLLKTSFPKAEVFHKSALFIDNELKSAGNSDSISLSISTQYFEIIGIKTKKLIAHNHFQFQSIDEFMFLLLSFIKQNGFKTENLDLKLSGKILMSSKIGQNLEQFFPNIHQADNSNISEKEIAFAEIKSYTLLANN
jgi:hypothetical protein